MNVTINGLTDYPTDQTLTYGESVKPTVQPNIDMRGAKTFKLSDANELLIRLYRGIAIQSSKDCQLSVYDEDTDTLLIHKKVNKDEICYIPLQCVRNYEISVLLDGHEDKLKVAQGSGDTLLNFPDGALGDTLGWFGYADRYQRKYGCRTVCAVPSWIIPLIEAQYPNLELVPCQEIGDIHLFTEIQLGLFFGGDTIRQTIDFRLVGNHTTVGHILGVDTSDVKTKLNLTAPRKIKEKYVCIAAQGSSKTKCWNNPIGWYEVIKFLKNEGYRVLCIDKHPMTSDGNNYNLIPPGAEDYTGDIPLQERIDLLKDADFFIGLSSGLSWLAWCCNIPVVLISGFTLPFNEFYTPYRIINYNGCTGCWNDMRENFDHHDYMWCPRHKGTPRQFECSRIISPKHVIKVIKSIPEFQANNHEPSVSSTKSTPAPESLRVVDRSPVYTVDCHLTSDAPVGSLAQAVNDDLVITVH